MKIGNVLLFFMGLLCCLLWLYTIVESFYFIKLKQIIKEYFFPSRKAFCERCTSIIKLRDNNTYDCNDCGFNTIKIFCVARNQKTTSTIKKVFIGNYILRWSCSETRVVCSYGFANEDFEWERNYKPIKFIPYNITKDRLERIMLLI